MGPPCFLCPVTSLSLFLSVYTVPFSLDRLCLTSLGFNLACIPGLDVAYSMSGLITIGPFGLFSKFHLPLLIA